QETLSRLALSHPLPLSLKTPNEIAEGEFIGPAAKRSTQMMFTKHRLPHAFNSSRKPLEPRLTLPIEITFSTLSELKWSIDSSSGMRTRNIASKLCLARFSPTKLCRIAGI